jgi:hypothetical protein
MELFLILNNSCHLINRKPGKKISSLAIMTKEKLRLYLHIGSPKAGSSAIQRFLNLNRKELAEKHSLLYPNFIQDDPSEGYMYNHGDFFRNANLKKRHEECISRIAESVDYCHKKGIGKIVVSAESWWWDWWPGLMKKAIDRAGVDCTIIVYLRRQDKFLESAWKQWGHKIEGCDTIMDYKKRLRLNWNNVLEPWERIFGAESIIARPYERSFIGNDIVMDFLTLVGINDLSDLSKPEALVSNANPGFGWDIVEILKYARSLVTDIHDNRFIYLMDEVLPESQLKKPMDDYSFLSPRQRLEIVNKYAGSNREIARKFLHWHDKDLFNDPLPDPDEEWEAPPALTLEKIIPFLMQIMLKQREQISALQNQLHELRRGS